MNNINFNKKQLAILIDPDKIQTNQIHRLCDEINNSAVDVILVGGSLVYSSIDDAISNIKEHCKLPVYIFPGSVFQISNKADGILFIRWFRDVILNILLGSMLWLRHYYAKLR
jgi:putative glycerol-1-phosphate prenyltransferase